MKKVCLILIACILLANSIVPAFAASSYFFAFMPPYKESARYTSNQSTTGNPYVDPSGTSLETIYALLNNAGFVSESTRSAGPVRPFHYLSGQGGAGQSVRMKGCPAYQDFNAYTVAGEWQP